MNKLILLLTLAVTPNAFSQGQIYFSNRVPTENIDAPVSYGGGGVVPGGRIDGGIPINVGDHVYGINAMVALFYGPAGVTQDQMIQAGPAISFRSGTSAGYFNGGLVDLLYVSPGSTATFQVRAWDAGVPNLTSYGDVLTMVRDGTATGYIYMGGSALFNISVPTTTTYLYGLQSFTLPVPEPSTTALAIIPMLAGLLMWVKRKHVA